MPDHNRHDGATTQTDPAKAIAQRDRERAAITTCAKMIDADESVEGKREEMDLIDKLAFTQVTSDNVQRVRALHALVFPVSYNDVFYNTLLATGEYSRLAWQGDQLVAAVCCRVEPIKSGPGQRVYIMTLGCLAPYRRRGIGSHLVRYVLDLCRREESVRQLYLHVQISNKEALTFYSQFGFRVVDTMYNYYKRVDPPHAHVLCVDPHDITAVQAPPSPTLPQRTASSSVPARAATAPQQSRTPSSVSTRNTAASVPTRAPSSGLPPPKRARQQLLHAYLQRSRPQQVSVDAGGAGAE